jgi:F-type H+-transporting ATPase subunit epsilon
VDGDVKKAAVHGGIIEILKDKVTVLAEVAEWPEEIDVNRANEAKIRAERRLASKEAGVDILRAEAALQRSLARLNASAK